MFLVVHMVLTAVLSWKNCEVGRGIHLCWNVVDAKLFCLHSFIFFGKVVYIYFCFI